MVNRRGASSVGCLFSLLVFVAVLYYGVNIGEVFFRYYRLVDEMQTQAQLAAALDDGTIRRRIQATAQDIGLPDQAQQIRDRKSTRLNSSHGYISYAVFCLKKKQTISAAIAGNYSLVLPS